MSGEDRTSSMKASAAFKLGYGSRCIGIDYVTEAIVVLWRDIDATILNLLANFVRDAERDWRDEQNATLGGDRRDSWPGILERDMLESFSDDAIQSKSPFRPYYDLGKWLGEWENRRKRDPAAEPNRTELLTCLNRLSPADAEKYKCIKDLLIIATETGEETSSASEAQQSIPTPSSIDVAALVATLTAELESDMPSGGVLGHLESTGHLDILKGDRVLVRDGMRAAFGTANRTWKLVCVLLEAGVTGCVRNELLAAVWPDRDVQPNNLDQQKGRANLILKGIGLEIDADNLGRWRIVSLGPCS